MTRDGTDQDRAGRRAADPFAEHRRLLFSVAYEILGSVADAEDTVQETYLRWARADQSSVSNPRAYLAQIVTREALGRLRAAARSRETYIGPWLPEPLATPADGGADALDHILTGEAVTTAMLLVLETLTQAQRAVFVLREVFDFSYPEIAVALERSEDAVRQLNQRARNRVRARRATVLLGPDEARSVTAQFSLAAASGDVRGLMDVLAPDVVFLADGGGQVPGTVQRPVRGQRDVARLLIGLLAKGERMGELDIRFATYNGMHSLVVIINGELDQVTSIEVADGKVSAVYCVRNPAKLASIRL